MDLKKLIGGIAFLRSYISLVVPAVIALIAILVFVPAQLISGSLENRIAEESIRKAQTIESLAKTAVSREQWQVERDYQQTFKAAATKAQRLAAQTSRREPLSYSVFPEPKDKSMLVFRDFGRRFREAVDSLVAAVNGRDCPTDVELDVVLQRSAARSRGGARGRARIGSRTLEDAILDVLCTERSRSAGVYVNPADLNGYEFWADYLGNDMEQALKDAWYYQLGYWIVEDVFKTVAALNAGSENILEAPVKRILLVDFELGSRGSSRRNASSEKPKYVVTEKDQMITSLTGRLCNEDIDVLHFNLSVLLSDSEVLSFMQQLCSVKEHKFRGFDGKAAERVFKHNQITVLQSGIWPVDRNSSVHDLYRYGRHAVVELNLICEYIFDVKGYEPIRPAAVKQDLEQARAAAAAGARGRRSRSSPRPATGGRSRSGAGE